MPSLQDQPQSNPVAAESSGREAAEFRPIVALAFVAGVLIPGGIAISEHGLAAWVVAAISLAFSCVGLLRLRRETSLLAGDTSTIATVTRWEEPVG